MRYSQLSSVLALAVTASASADSSCRCFPGDACWPAKAKWDVLNSTVGGALIKTTPLASVCRGLTFSEAACSDLKVAWPNPDPHYELPASPWAPLFQDRACTPFSGPDANCTMDKYVAYSVAATTLSDVISTVNFARDNNIRLVIKSSGHDLLGKSRGPGALELWTHKMNDITFLTHASEHYSGPAVKLGAGVQGNQILEAANARGMVALSGTCAGVSPAGGYAQGGGFSMLSTQYGLAADNVLEWEVVTSDGRHVIASPTHQPDLYWALSGGGGSTYAAVVSMTYKTFVDTKVGSVNVTLLPSADNPDTYWDAITSFHKHSVTWTSEAGAGVVAFFGAGGFQLFPLTLSNATAAEALAVVQPWLDDLEALNATYLVDSTTSPTFLDHFARYFGPLPYGNIWLGQVQSGRLVPRATIADNLDELISAYQNITSLGPYSVSITGLDVSSTKRVAPNAVLPQWRTTAHEVFVFQPWDFDAQSWESNYAIQAQLTNVVDPLLLSVMPESGGYLNQANPEHKTWKKDFYGVNYDRLRKVKAEYDQADLFYAPTAVGSDEWKADARGRLCKV
ncbi:putative isoamyl alcohol oxidase [Periconia macrospinosa]|uniref:Putative isoamyl alcohol oxidase n=1 Tax=Periconia macrospinosa TaxID=97972 RepID=A0A2V1DFP0_9PLEO|nr:putative isoamyl alcohol oxidase [Periconia macrospinosa]